MLKFSQLTSLYYQKTARESINQLSMPPKQNMGLKNDTKIGENLWIAGGYYVDFDDLGQFRIIGPNNHLYCGLVDIPPHKIKIKSVAEKDNILRIKGIFISPAINLYYPAMDDIRTMRKTEHQDTGEYKSFLQIRNETFEKLTPRVVKIKSSSLTTSLIFRRVYEENFYYETVFEFSKEIRIKKITKPYRGYKVSSSGDKISFAIKATTNDIRCKKFNNFFGIKKDNFDFKVFGKRGDFLKKIWERTEKEIEHLLSWGKTSGDRFGTIFPRDWMESADLGVNDLTPEARSYMYEASLKNVNEKGEGWHEDVVGEYRYEFEVSGKDIFDRHMIDIEPRYILGMKFLPNDFFLSKENRERLKWVANYVLLNARSVDYIFFEALPPERQKPGDKYYDSGNWRDSAWAFKKIADVIAPFDVNAVFYPEALKVLKIFQSKLSMEIKDIDKLISKWEDKKNKYLFKNADGKIAYAMALYKPDFGAKKVGWQKMEVNHLDESYLYAYGEATKEEVGSFCDRLMDRNYFYTDSGPLITARKNPYGYTTAEYHGLVIWVKQTSYAALALSKALKKAIIEEWDKKLIWKIKNAILKISENTFNAFETLGAIPELYWDDDGKARLFSDQPNVEASMSKVQLWSAVGARRIIRKYYELLTDPRYKI